MQKCVDDIRKFVEDADGNNSHMIQARIVVFKRNAKCGRISQQDSAQAGRNTGKGSPASCSDGSQRLLGKRRWLYRQDPVELGLKSIDQVQLD